LTDKEKIQAVLKQMKASEIQWLKELYETEQAKANHAASQPNTQTPKPIKEVNNDSSSPKHSRPSRTRLSKSH
jgi:hypothetical protein